jgi:hypothetical protein
MHGVCRRIPTRSLRELGPSTVTGLRSRASSATVTKSCSKTSLRAQRSVNQPAGPRVDLKK